MRRKHMREKENKFDRTSKLAPYFLCSIYSSRIFKLFGLRGLRSWLAGTGKRAGLINQRGALLLASSSFFTEISHPAHKPIMRKKEK